MKNIRINLFLLTAAAVMLASCNQGSVKPQPELGFRSASIIEKHGLKFKDLNKNGKLDKYEDWRLTSEERSSDLVSKMSLEEKAGFMVINSLNMVGTPGAAQSEGKLDASDLDEGGGRGRGGRIQGGEAPQRQGRAQERPAGGGERPGGQAAEYAASLTRIAGTSKMVKEYHMRHFILRSNESARITAEWANKLQELCESEPLGIPAIIASNPRNHITTNAALGSTVGTTVFSVWPGELGLSAMRDLELTRTFADIARQEWLSVGLRKGYMYMADLSTEPRWSRINGTLGEDAEWVAKMIREIILGFQGEKLGPSSVALTTKHFPGGGSGEKGQDSHFDWGKKEIYPGGMFRNNLIPFQAAIDAGTSAIMPYYSMPSGTEFEEVGYAYNKAVLTDILRTQLGFKGIINSDTGPIDRMPWGVEALSIPERYKKAIEAGVNIFSGISDPSEIINVVKNNMVDISLIDNSVSLLLKEKFDLGLFENPYVDANAAEKIVNNENFREKADLALRKSVVLLRNESNALPLKPKTKIYFETMEKSSRGQQASESAICITNDGKYETEFVNSPAKADLVVLWIIPTGNALFGSTGTPISLSLSKNNVDV